jgi:hypothetical protein
VNEDPTEKLIKDLKEENEKLKAQLSGGKIDINEIRAMSGNENLSKEGINKFWRNLNPCLKFESTRGE